jgi:acyl-CoA synthetase (NDP forming)
MWKANPGSLDVMLEALAAHAERSSKPFVAVLQPQHVEEVVIEARKRAQERGLAVFSSFERAARALNRAIEHHRVRAVL